MIDWLKPAINWIGRLLAGLSAFIFGWKAKESSDAKSTLQAVKERQESDRAVDALSDDAAVIELSKWKRKP